MISFKHTSSKQMGMLAAIVIGLVASIVICTGIVLVVPVFILNGNLDPEVIKILAIIVQVIISFVGSFITGSLLRDTKVIAVCVNAGLLWIILSGSGVLLFEGNIGSWWGGILSCYIGSICSLLLIRRGTKAKKTVKVKRRSR